ncbi:hypothetical protein [Bradyrhizobium sp. 151]|uniref:hypothetical protein n=1 Tax=Bradyrhizobium sp. 151 TaxID=2782626 RepID=UPI001FF714B3|nr:hypothetical protein [Bradyrhizobium sp. 151]MCK1656669.1 hypothetical protein [Bradyrhizobium sp. 151]
MQPDAAPQNKQVHLADDILRGADAIAEFLFHGTSEDQRDRNRRKVYYLAESSRLPLFRLGSMLCARKSVLLDFIAAQEIRALEERGIAGTSSQILACVVGPAVEAIAGAPRAIAALWPPRLNQATIDRARETAPGC